MFLSLKEIVPLQRIYWRINLNYLIYHHFMKKNLLLSSIFGCMLMVSPVSADVIGMRTAVPVGDKMSIALNENVKATITWGDGSTENIEFKGSEVEITVKHADLTLTTNTSVFSLYCPDCSLTSLELKDTPKLVSLLCPDNQLTELNLKATPLLENLNCEGNQLKSLSLSKCHNLVNLNCSGNQLTSLSLATQTKLKELMCGYNDLKGLYVSNQPLLETLWCQGNSIKNVNFASVARPVQICAFDNAIEELHASNLADAEELWLDNNKMKSIDLSEAFIKVLSASNNELKLIQLDKHKVDSLKAFYVDNNELLINSLPNLYIHSYKDSLMHFNISEQRPYVVTEKVNVNEQLDLSDLLLKNAENNTIRSDVDWYTEDGKALVSKEDYTSRSNHFTFLKPFKSVGAKITSNRYPNETFYIANFQVVDPTGIENVATENNLKISAKSGQLVVVAPNQTNVRACTVSGALVIDEVVSAGTHRWTLPAGVYVVNGQKVVLNH